MLTATPATGSRNALMPPGWTGQPMPTSPALGSRVLVPSAALGTAPALATAAGTSPGGVGTTSPTWSASPGVRRVSVVGSGLLAAPAASPRIMASASAGSILMPMGTGSSPASIGGSGSFSIASSPVTQSPTPMPKRQGSGDSVSTRASNVVEEDDLGDEMLALCKLIDADGNGTISELELIAAVRAHPGVASFVLPGVDPSSLMEDEHAFDAIDDVFEKIAAGKQRIRYSDFVAHFRRRGAERTSNAQELQTLYRLIDADGSGSVSKLELVDAVQRHPKVANLVLPGRPFGSALGDEEAFDLVKKAFDQVSGGKKRFDYADFEAHFRKVHHAPPAVVTREHNKAKRSSKRVMIIGPGFGKQMNPMQGQLIEDAGFRVRWCWEGLPNPETPNFDTRPYLARIKAEIDAFEPDVIACGSKGGAYMAGLWNHGLWAGSTLLINAHPSVLKMPAGSQVVLCHGSNDEVYATPRAKLEELVATGAPNKCFLYYTANSGQLPSGHFSRVGDQHNMQSILNHDCLPRLLDAAMSPTGPEIHMLHTWRERLTEERLHAERELGYCPDMLRKRWTSRGCDGQKLFEVLRGTDEFNQVAAVFKAQPVEPPAYLLSPKETWERARILKVQRVENAALLDSCSTPYFSSLRRSIEDQDLEFEPGVHTSWAFHGADANAIDSIVNSPVAGFQPLASGTRGASLWGSGTYFARDAKYVADGGFCGKPAADGTRKMLMCLLMTGMPCLGDPNHKGVLPFRIKPHRYHCSVDCLSSPEVYIMQHSGAAHAAYLITFA